MKPLLMESPDLAEISKTRGQIRREYHVDIGAWEVQIVLQAPSGSFSYPVDQHIIVPGRGEIAGSCHP